MDLFNEDILKYKKHLDLWDTAATVRSRKNRYDYRSLTNNKLRSMSWFLEDAYPIFLHELLAKLDREQKQYLMGKFLIAFLNYSTIIEHELVNTITVEIAQNIYGDLIPEVMRIDAYKIYTDEAYHAYFAAEGANQIREHLHIHHNKGSLNHTRLNLIRGLINSTSIEHKFLMRLGIVTVSETVIAKEIHDKMKGTVLSPTYNMFKDHLHLTSPHEFTIIIDKYLI